jgi:endonuclease YncB( thermonuclease family)
VEMRIRINRIDWPKLMHTRFKNHAEYPYLERSSIFATEIWLLYNLAPRYSGSLSVV